MIKFYVTQGVKLTKESLPAFADRIKSGEARSILMSHVKDGKNLGTWGSTLNAQAYKDDAVAKLQKAANLPENCGEIFVEIV